MKQTISNKKRDKIFSKLKDANNEFQKEYPGERKDRQPVQTLYGGANLFKFNSAKILGARALETFQTYAPDFITFGKIFQLPGIEKIDNNQSPDTLKYAYETLDAEAQKAHPAWLSNEVYYKVIHKLKSEAIEDFRIDFEDGYGNRTNEEEDATAMEAANEVAKGMAEGTLPPFIGIRIKPFTEEMKERGLRTLELFIATLAKKTGGALPKNFVVMLPKVTIPEQPEALALFFDILEKELGLKKGILQMEMMVETTQSIMAADGTNPLLRFVKAAKGRCIAMHFGTYDYTASVGITARYQEMDHPVCDFAHHMTKVALAHTGIWLSDGATNTMPIGPHRGDELSEEKQQENKAIVHRSWKKGYDHIRHSLWNGYYQGWDLNPAQLPMRYAAVFAFFLESYDDAVERLRTFVEKAARATLIGDVFDDAATGQGLLNYFLRALNSGAITEEEALKTGLTLEEIHSRSFKKILENRKKILMDVWSFIESKIAADIATLLMVVVQSEGSSPGRQGFMMAVAKDGTFTGTIGGGIMEHKLVEKAKAMLAKETFSISLIWQYHDKKAAHQSGMICSGSQVIAFVPVVKSDLPLIKEINSSFKKRDSKAITISPEGLAINNIVEKAAQPFFNYKSEQGWQYSAPINEQPVVHIFGAGHVGLALSQQLAMLDFYIHIYDNRPNLNTLKENEFAHQKHIIDYEHLDALEFSSNDYVVIVTVGYKTDKIIFRQLLSKPFFYMGMMGSDAKIKTLLEELKSEGFSPDLWKDYFLPIGLPVHSRTAAEIAVSIAAQMINEKNKNLPTGRKNN